jgi:HSP20 family molecular chaperone IbpA
MNRRNRKDPNDIFGLNELLDAWMDMMAVIPQIDARAIPKTAIFGKPKHEGTMSYEERDKDIVFTIDMPGVEKKDIDIKVENHSITVKAENGIPIEGTKHGRKYNYTRKFKPTVDTDSAVATFKNGVLDITLTKVPEIFKGKSVKIK